MLAAFALGANAYEVDDFVYTKTAKYQVTGANLVANGKFDQGASGTDGWVATDETSAPLSQVFVMKIGGPNGSNTQAVLSGQTALTAGMYQLVPIERGGTYVVTLRVMGATAGFTDLDLTGANTNYINAYWNTDAALATASGTDLLYGENGVSGGYGFSFSTDGFTEVSFAIEVPNNEGFIIIDLRGLNEGLEIGDVECHAVQEVYDDRIADRRIAYIQKYLNAYDLTNMDLYPDLMEMIEEVQNAVENNASPEDMAVQMENLDNAWAEFTATSFSNVLDLIPPITGSVSSGGLYSANWDNWAQKFNTLNSEFPTDRAPWTWSTNRWCHKTAEVNTPMSIQWMRGAGTNDVWDNIATLTATLDKGKYYWGFSGDGGKMTLNKNRWARSWAADCAGVQLFFNGDTTDVFTLDPATRMDYVYAFELDEDKEITLGIRCNMIGEDTNGGADVNFYSPVLYQVLEEGQLTPEQKAYIAAVNTQLEALKGRIDLANSYLDPEQTEMPWGKETLQIGVDEAQERYDAWAAMSQDEILDKMDNFEVLADEIMNDGVRALNNNYITPFVTMNAPLTNMPIAIEAAKATQSERIYASSSKMDELTAKINEAQALYDEKLVAPFSSEDSLALVNEKAALEAFVVEFTLAIDKVNLVDIDFGTQSAPATIVTVEDPTYEVDTYYTIAGANGLMKITDTTGSYCYALGYNDTDSLGMLRVGNSEAVVEFTAPINETDIVNIQFDYYFGNLSGKSCGFYVRTADDENICGLFCSKYSGTADYNSFDMDFNNLISAVGSSSAANAAIAAASNATHFNVVLDYGAKEMYCTTSNSSKGTATSEKIALPGLIPAKFVISSNYNNADRRSWFDNLTIDNIAAEATGVQGVEVVAPAVGNDAIYNVAGQQISAPVKGQIYIKNGAAFVK